jgi:hypothetical protein
MAEMEPGDLRFPLHPEDGLHILQGPGGKGGIQQKILILFVPIHFVLQFFFLPLFMILHILQVELNEFLINTYNLANHGNQLKQFN